MATAAKFVQPIAIFWAYLIQLDVDATGNITAKKKFNPPTAVLPHIFVRSISRKCLDQTL
jgi:hypothetical protein